MTAAGIAFVTALSAAAILVVAVFAFAVESMAMHVISTCGDEEDFEEKEEDGRQAKTESGGAHNEGVKENQA